MTDHKVALTWTGFRYHLARPGTNPEYARTRCGQRVRDYMELSVAARTRSPSRKLYTECLDCFK